MYRICHSSKSCSLFLVFYSFTMTKSTRRVRLWSCWACYLTHRRHKSLMEGEREETESVCCAVVLSHLLLGCLLLLCARTRPSLTRFASYSDRFLLFCFYFIHVNVVTGWQSAFFYPLPPIWSFSGLLAQVTLKLSLPFSCLLVIFLHFILFNISTAFQHWFVPAWLAR